MFPFHNLLVYQKARAFRTQINDLLILCKAEEPLRSQLKRASLSIVLNIAEGSGRFSNADRKNFFVIARGSVFECIAALDALLDDKKIIEPQYHSLYSPAAERSRILYTLIGKLRPAAHIAEKQ